MKILGTIIMIGQHKFELIQKIKTNRGLFEGTFKQFFVSQQFSFHQVQWLLILVLGACFPRWDYAPAHLT